MKLSADSDPSTKLIVQTSTDTVGSVGALEAVSGPDVVVVSNVAPAVGAGVLCAEGVLCGAGESSGSLGGGESSGSLGAGVSSGEDVGSALLFARAANLTERRLPSSQ